jgi:hypothetical protein
MLRAAMIAADRDWVDHALHAAEETELAEHEHVGLGSAASVFSG